MLSHICTHLQNKIYFSICLLFWAIACQANSKLEDAILENNVNALMAKIDKGEMVDEQDVADAAKYKKVDAFEFLLNNYVGSINARACKWTASINELLNERNISSAERMLDFLIKKVGKIDCSSYPDRYALSTLSIARYYWSDSIVERLLKAGLDPNRIVQPDARQPLQLAFVAFKNSLGTRPQFSKPGYYNENVQRALRLNGLLLSYGANPNKDPGNYLHTGMVWLVDRNLCGKGRTSNDNAIPEIYKMYFDKGFRFDTSQYNQIQNRKTDIEQKMRDYTDKTDDYYQAECSLAWSDAFVATINKFQPELTGNIGSEALNEKLGQALFDYGSAKFNNNKLLQDDTREKITYFLKKGANPSANVISANCQSIAASIIDSGDIDLIRTMVETQRNNISLKPLGRVDGCGYTQDTQYEIVEYALGSRKIVNSIYYTAGTKTPREEVVLYLINQGFGIKASVNELLIHSARRGFRSVSAKFIELGGSPEVAINSLAGDDASVAIVAHAAGSRGEGLLAKYQEDQRRLTEQQAHNRQTAKAELAARQVEEARRDAEAANKRKTVGDRVCMVGRVAFGLLKATVTGFVERTSGDRIQVRIADTDGTSIRYQGISLSKDTILWDDFRNWAHCSR